MHDAFDERGRACGAGKDRVPFGEGEIGGQHEAFLLIPTADDLKDQIGVAIVEGEKAELVEHREPDLCVVVEAPLECAGGFLAAEVEQELGSGQEENGASGEDRAVRDILGDHRLSESPGGDEDDVAGALEEVERGDRFDQGAVDGRGPVPVEVGEGFELLEARARAATFQTTTGTVLLFEIGDVLEDFGGSPSFLGGESDEVIDRIAGGEDSEGAKASA